MRRGQDRPLRGSVRIIAGRWRGRRIAVPDLPGVRPTPDRVRETLFNWLAPVIEGATCLDCFAGTGALSFEALSRGANSVVMLENDHRAVELLRKQASVLGAAAEIHCENALDWLRREHARFDIIFVDPPFDSTLASDTCALLANGRHLAPAGLVYVESAHGWRPPAGHFVEQRQGRAGQVQYLLLAPANGEPQ